jgi:hypothetical protein
MLLTIDTKSLDLDALGDALELADALISQSEYSDRKQAAREKNSVRKAWKVYKRLVDAQIAAVSAGPSAA